MNCRGSCWPGKSGRIEHDSHDRVGNGSRAHGIVPFRFRLTALAEAFGARRLVRSVVHFRPGMSIPFRSRVRRPRVRPEEIGTITDPYAPLRFVAFRWFILSLLPSTLAQQIQAVVVGWQIYALTHDPLALGLIGLSEALPFIGIALFAGHVADRIDRRRIALVSLTVMLGCAATLFVLAFHLTRGSAVWPIYGVIALSGVARSFMTPSRAALAAELVPRELHHPVENPRQLRFADGLDQAVGRTAAHGVEFAVAVRAVEQLNGGHECPEQAAKVVPQFRVAVLCRLQLVEGTLRSRDARGSMPQRRGGLLRGEGGEWHGESAER